jgi:hypothetical protein
MTVISTIITKRFTAHATDSLLTPFGSRNKEDKEWEKTKIVKVPHWRGAMAYWGTASTIETGWDTLGWLSDRAGSYTHQFDNPEEYAKALRRELNREFRNMKFQEPGQGGLGIHFTCYEWIDNYWIPEMFKISNWTDNFYNAVHTDGFKLERVTYHTSFNSEIKETPEDGKPDRRLEVHRKLQDGMMLIYNNGDPVLFNLPANALLGMLQTLAARGALKDLEDPLAICAIARRPIEVVGRVLRDFCRENAVWAGGKPHDLAISPNGEYWSNTGDHKD